MESSGGHGGGDGDLVKLVSLTSLVELFISSKDFSFVIQLKNSIIPFDQFQCIKSVTYMYSRTSCKRTPSRPEKSVRLREVSTYERLNNY